ncbi:DUF4838 domain-containing protein, partial [Candidatus Calescamantes bacterium]|nr:DUF4838 domain-containing protein [Candidatus Calescamantes bacterium]
WRSLPVPLMNIIKKDLQYFMKIGIKGICTFAEPADWWTYELNFYVHAKLSWNPEIDLEELLDDFYKKRYGKANNLMKQYFSTLEKAMLKLQKPGWVYPPKKIESIIESLETCNKILDTARKKNNEKKILARIKKAKLSTDYAKLEMLSNKALLKASDFIASGKYHQAIKELAKSLKKDNEIVKFYNINKQRGVILDDEYWGLKSYVISRRKKTKLVKKILEYTPEKVILLENEFLKIEVLPDVGGRVLQIKDKETEYNYLANFVLPITQVTEDLDYGGYGTCLGHDIDGLGYDSKYACKKVKGKQIQKLLLQSKVRSYLITKEIIIEDSSKEIVMNDVVTNCGKKPEKIAYRIYSRFHRDMDRLYILQQKKILQQKSLNVVTKWTVKWSEVIPQGLWMIADNKKNTGMANYFNPTHIEKCLVCESPNYYGLDLLFAPRIIKSGESASFNHKYYLISKTSEFLTGYNVTK